MKLVQEGIHHLVELIVIKTMINSESKYYIPVSVSNRHVHLCASDVEALFGKDYCLKKMRDLIQPGQYACKEQVALIGPKGSIEKIRVLGPVRDETQVELTITDAYKVGIEPVIRLSGQLENTPGCRLAGPAGEIILNSGVIVAKRHLHISEEQAKWFGIGDGDSITVKYDGSRPVIFEDVLVRSGLAHTLEMHIDTDEANAAKIRNGSLLVLVR